MTFEHLPYRPCAGVCLINKNGLIFGGKRIDNPIDAWQMPQGGIDAGEDVKAAAFRELEEETGVTSAKVKLLAFTRDWLPYDLPEELKGVLWGGKFRGQRQKWFAFQYLGEDSDINIHQNHQEFSDWRWMEKEEMIAKIVPFKREIYTKVLSEFDEFLR